MKPFDNQNRDRELGFIIKPFDNQGIGDIWLVIKSFDYFVYKTFTHKSNKPDQSHWLSPHHNHPHPFSYQPPAHRSLLVFPVCVIIMVKTQWISVASLVLIPGCNVFSSVLFREFLLRAFKLCCFQAEGNSLPPSDAGEPWNCHRLHITTSRHQGTWRWFTWACPDSCHRAIRIQMSFWLKLSLEE
jgi:hypothetical protein